MKMLGTQNSRCTAARCCALRWRGRARSRWSHLARAFAGARAGPEGRPGDAEHRRCRGQTSRLPRTRSSRSRKSIPSSIAKINSRRRRRQSSGKTQGMQGVRPQRHRPGAHRHDFLAAGIEQGVLMKILPTTRPSPNLVANYQPAAAKMQELAQDYGVAVAVHAGRPLRNTTPTRSSRSRPRRPNCSHGARRTRTS